MWHQVVQQRDLVRRHDLLLKSPGILNGDGSYRGEYLHHLQLLWVGDLQVDGLIEFHETGQPPAPVLEREYQYIPLVPRLRRFARLVGQLGMGEEEELLNSVSLVLVRSEEHTSELQSRL